MMKQELIWKENNIKSKIYTIRGKQVMLDSDLAILYGCTNGTKLINQAVKRNPNRFPEDFYFQLTKEEYLTILRSQTVTLELKQGQYSKYLPYVFTEQGISMLSSVLHTENAAKISVLMRVFVEMREYISNELLEQWYINQNIQSTII